MKLWKFIIGNEKYEVSSDGEVKNSCTGRILRQFLRRDYPSVELYKEGDGVIYYVHRLVAAAFIDNPTGKPCINQWNKNR